MKKSIYLCGMMLITMNIMAQIDLNDKNWECFIDENFSGIRSWNDYLWEDKNLSIPNYVPIWRCFNYESWMSGVTLFDHSTHEFQGYHAFQKSNAVFGPDNTMNLVGEFISPKQMHCDTNYMNYNTSYAPCDTCYLSAPWYKYCHECDTFPEQHPDVHYYSGMIETIDPVGFGYYEIECKMPVHPGAYSAFWFYSTLGGTYNEIDVFEHSKGLSHYDFLREFVSGIWYNSLGPNYYPDANNGEAIRYASYHHLLPSTSTVEDYHKYGCLWLPEKVEFYVDGNIVNECDNPEQIPQFPMWLKITHIIDRYALYPDLTWWQGSDEMTINYVKVYRLKSGCDSIVTIRSNTDLDNYYFSVKNSITMGAQTGVLTLPNDSIYTMRAVESITIDGGFEVPVGTELTLITQECPQWSFEGLNLPSYSCGMTEFEEKTSKKAKK